MFVVFVNVGASGLELVEAVGDQFSIFFELYREILNRVFGVLGVLELFEVQTWAKLGQTSDEST